MNKLKIQFTFIQARIDSDSSRFNRICIERDSKRFRIGSESVFGMMQNNFDSLGLNSNSKHSPRFIARKTSSPLVYYDKISE